MAVGTYHVLIIPFISGKEPEVIKKSNVLSLFIHGVKRILKAIQTNRLTFSMVPLMAVLNDKDVYQCSSDTIQNTIFNLWHRSFTFNSNKSPT